MEEVIVGSLAVQGGGLTRGRLRWHYRPIFPDVYVPRTSTPSTRHRILAAWLWSKRRGVVAGLSASALHGARTQPDRDVELIYRSRRAPLGIVTRCEHIDDDEIVEIGGMPVTTVARTALDLARHDARDSAVVNLDALARATAVTYADVEPLLDRYRGHRGAERARRALRLMDGGSASARETRVRLRMIDAGMPAPGTHIPVTDDTSVTHVALGYRAPKVGVVFGEHVPEALTRMGWKMISTAHAFNDAALVGLVRSAVIERGYPLWRLRAEFDRPPGRGGDDDDPGA